MCARACAWGGEGAGSDEGLTAQGHGNDVSPEPVGVEAKLFEDALPANSQRGQHAAVERACEEERRGRLVEFVDLHRAGFCRLRNKIRGKRR